MGDAEAPWSAFSKGARFWCVRPWSDGVETWYGAYGEKGRVVATLDADPAARIPRVIAEKRGQGYAPGELPAKMPSPRAVRRARTWARYLAEPRFRGYRAVEEAVAVLDVERLRALLSAGRADPMVASPADPEDGVDPWPHFFHSALGHPAHVLAVYLEHGADPTAVVGGQTALHLAASRGRVANVELLLASGATVDTRDGNGQTILHVAAMGMVSRERFAMLVALGADVDARDADGRTPLHAAAEERVWFAGASDALEVLLAAGADVHARDAAGRTPLDRCLDLSRGGGSGSWASREAALRAAGATPTSQGEGRDELLRLLDELPPRPRTSGRTSTLSEAALTGDLDLVRAFLDDGVDPEGAWRDGWYPVQRAHDRHHVAVIDLLVARGAEDRPGRFGSPPRPEAVAFGEVMRQVTRAFSPEREGTTLEPRVVAAHLARCVELIEEGAVGDPATLRVGRETLLTHACEQHLVPIVRALLEAGVDPDGVGGEDWPLMAGAHHPEILELLLAAGADPSRHDPDRGSVLSHVAASGRIELVQRLLEAGADPMGVQSGGQTSFNQAIGPQRNAIRRMLRAAATRMRGGKPSKRKAVKLSRRKAMYDDPAARHGTCEHDAYAWQPGLGGLRAPIEVVAERLAPTFAYDRDIVGRPAVGVTQGCFLLQLVGSVWTVVVPIASITRTHDLVRDLSTALGVEGFVRRPAPDRVIRFPGGETLAEPCERFFEERALWLPPVNVDGEGLYDYGDVHVLVLKGVHRADVARVDRLTFLE